MRATLFCLLVLFLHILLCLDGVSTRHLHPNHVANIENRQPLEIMKKKRVGLEVVVEREEKMREIGSRVPRCDDKCYGCMPCQPIQVPTNAAAVNGGVGVQYTNYEPEAWKCKCGPSFYAP
ncbi:hypothetical protein ABFS82_09G119300 [Erythranthe guttata]